MLALCGPQIEEWQDMRLWVVTNKNQSPKMQHRWYDVHGNTVSHILKVVLQEKQNERALWQSLAEGEFSHCRLHSVKGIAELTLKQNSALLRLGHRPDRWGPTEVRKTRSGVHGHRSAPRTPSGCGRHAQGWHLLGMGHKLQCISGTHRQTQTQGPGEKADAHLPPGACI